MNTMDKRVVEFVKEIKSWGLSEDELLKFSAMLRDLNNAREIFNSEILNNRLFCYVCSLKTLAEESLRAENVIDFLRTIRSCNPTSGDIVYLCNEIFLLSYMMNFLEANGLHIVRDHLLNHVKLKYPNALQSEEFKKKIEDLSIFFLSINTMINEICKKLIHCFYLQTLSIVKDKEQIQRILVFFADLFTSFSPRKIIIFDDEEDRIDITLYKFSKDEISGFDIHDPITSSFKHTD
jgi:hypothetical protein